MPFSTDAVCVLPDHLHAIWTLPEGDDDYSTRWRKIKGLFTRSFLAEGGTRGDTTESKIRKGEAGVWQRRFWEHSIRDTVDFDRHTAYIHFNPVKHGYATSAADWEWSTFHDYVKEGFVEPDWGTLEPEEIREMDTGE